MIAGALIAQRLNKTEGRKAALGASVISCEKKPQESCEWEMNRWNARKHRGQFSFLCFQKFYPPKTESTSQVQSAQADIIYCIQLF